MKAIKKKKQIILVIRKKLDISRGNKIIYIIFIKYKKKLRKIIYNKMNH